MDVRELPLTKEYARRLKAYDEWLDAARAELPDQAKSDYWKLHSGRARIEFGDGFVRIAGDSGFYIPPESSFVRAMKGRVQRTYRRAVLAGDRYVRLSAAHALAAALPADLAYDYLFSRRVAFEEGCYADNPYHFDVTQVRPRFASFAQLRAEWFLRHRFYPTPGVIHAAFYHAVFNHFGGSGRTVRYLEIGAGNGNLASFFHHYDRARVTIIDLPETILFSATYLGSVFSDAQIALPNEIEGVALPQLLATHDFVFLTPTQTSLLPAQWFDTMVNCFSMQEMTTAQVAEYFDLIARVGKPDALWANVNRVEKFCSRDQRPTRAYEYPYDPNSKVLVDQIDEFVELMQSTPCMLHIERLPS